MFLAACGGGGSSSDSPGSQLKITIVNLACPSYALPVRTSASSAQFAEADKIKSVCTIVLTGWSATPEGHRAKYYELTTAGQRKLAVEKKNWARIVLAIGQVLEAD